ncbi:class I SAM-dependent methyltransferase [Orenia marismortui]|uniref:Methyltransferase family protein n=1 Tax=Orenia marismortui TaxID=46469 RepID=A0A4R8H1D0_9FIRM|nr:class I SAM-dependent methyltransferase [Orenia marismortui]TDX53327.1 methyltransferase family protein [Orenia marismortui]
MNNRDLCEDKRSISGSFSWHTDAYTCKKYEADRVLLYDSLLKRLHSLNFNSILDVGCGKGSLLARINKFDQSITLAGLDSSADKIRVAKRRLGEKSDLIICDSEILPWDEGSFDLVVCSEAFQRYTHPERVLSEMKRVIKPNGYLIVGDYWKITPLRQINNLFRAILNNSLKIYSKTEISDLLEQYSFKLTEWELIDNSIYILVAQKGVSIN